MCQKISTMLLTGLKDSLSREEKHMKSMPSASACWSFLIWKLLMTKRIHFDLSFLFRFCRPCSNSLTTNLICPSRSQSTFVLHIVSNPTLVLSLPKQDDRWLIQSHAHVKAKFFHHKLDTFLLLSSSHSSFFTTQPFYHHISILTQTGYTLFIPLNNVKFG